MVTIICTEKAQELINKQVVKHIIHGTEDPLYTSRDAACQVLGSAWRMPTQAQIDELRNYTLSTWYDNFNNTRNKR